MALRFRRSVKLGKGIKMNVSKRGVGMSFGTRGARQSFHSTGEGTQSIGIPGTGLSYVKRQKLSKKRPAKQQSSNQDPSQNEAAVEQFNNYIHAITHLHQNVPETTDWQSLKAQPAPFDPSEVGPREAEAKAELEGYEPNVLARIIKPLANRQKKQLEQAILTAREEDSAEMETWQKWNDLAEGVLGGDADAYQQAIDENGEFDSARERGFSLSVPSAKTAEAELQVAPKDVIPNKTLTLTKTGKVSKRKMGKKVYYKLTKDFVCSYVLWLSRALFATLPIDSCVIHVTENALNTTTGHRKNKVLLSVKIDQPTLEKLNFENIDPSDAMNNFEHHMNHLKTKGFREVKRL